MNKSEKFWDRLSKGYDKDTKADRDAQSHIKISERARQYLTSNDIVLDFGCATGTVAIAIADKVKEVNGIDISSKMIDAAKRKAAEHKIQNINFEHATLFDERYKSESFNVVFVLNVLHLLEDTSKVIQRIHELLKPGGLIISLTPCMGKKKSFIQFALFLLMKTGILPYIRFFKVSELEEALTDGNFQIIRTESLNNSPLNHFIVAKKI